MASTEKMTRKEMKEPDAFQKLSAEIVPALQQHQRTIVLVVVGIFVLAAVGGLVTKLAQKKDTEAAGALSKALETARRGVEGATDMTGDPDLPKFKTAKEKQEELAKELGEVRQKYAGTDSARLAALYFGDAQYQLGNYDEAIKSYEEFLKGDEPVKALKGLALEGLGYAYEAKKDYAKAEDAYNKLADVSDEYKARAALNKARLLEAQGKLPEAAAAYQKVKADFKEGAVTREAADRIGLLAAKGVAIPEEPKKPAEKPEEKK